MIAIVLDQGLMAPHTPCQFMTRARAGKMFLERHHRHHQFIAPNLKTWSKLNILVVFNPSNSVY